MTTILLRVFHMFPIPECQRDLAKQAVADGLVTEDLMSLTKAGTKRLNLARACSL